MYTQRLICHSLYRKFIQTSYVRFGCGPQSRNAQFVVHQCVHILYALRLAYLYHCVYTVHDADCDEPAKLSELFLNSTRQSGFTALQNIKRPGWKSIAKDDSQNVTWTGSGYKQLEVHTGRFGLDRVKVSHMMLEKTFKNILNEISQDLLKFGIKIIKYREFQQTRDSRTSSNPGEGMSVFNEHKSHAGFFLEGRSRAFRLEFLDKASRIYRLAIAAIHLCGGPSPRGTEEAVIRLLNSSTEAVRNVQMMEETIGIENG
jgi:hypothetical protein